MRADLSVFTGAASQGLCAVTETDHPMKGVMPMDAPEDRSRKKMRGVPLKQTAAVGGALAVILLCLVLWRANQPEGYRPDPNADPIAVHRKEDLGKLQNQLQSQADESGFRLQINAKPRVTGAQAELLLGNPVQNTLCLSVDLVLDEDGEVLYQSETLVPGAQVLTATLTKTLSPGEHPATAVCRAIDPATGNAVGTPVRADLMLEAAAPENTAEPESIRTPAPARSQAD